MAIFDRADQISREHDAERVRFGTVQADGSVLIDGYSAAIPAIATNALYTPGEGDRVMLFDVRSASPNAPSAWVIVIPISVAGP